MTNIYLPTKKHLDISLNIPVGLFLIYEAFEDDHIQPQPLEQHPSRYYQIIGENPLQSEFLSPNINDGL